MGLASGHGKPRAATIKTVLLLCVALVPQNDASIEKHVLRYVRSKFGGRVAGAAGQTINIAMNSDEILECLVSIMPDNLSFLSGNVSKLNLHRHIDNITTDFCVLVDNMNANWDNGCGVLMKLVIPIDNYWVCAAARTCLHMSTRITPIHGECFKRCSNTFAKNWTTVTDCEEHAFVKSGMLHEKICDGLPVEVHLNLAEPFEMMFTLLGAAALKIFEIFLPLSFDDPPRGLGVSDVLSMLIHFFALLHITQYTADTMRAMGANCDFVIVNLPLFYTPFMVSTVQILMCALKVDALFVAPGKAPDMKGIELCCDPCQQFSLNNWSSGCWQMTLIAVCSPTFIVFSVMAIFIALSGISMILATFWGFIAYFYFVLFLCICWCVVVLVFFGMLLGFEWTVGNSIEWLYGKHKKEKHENQHMVVVSFTALVPQWVTGFAWFMYVGTNVFFLYFHGNYMQTLNGLWEGLNFRVPTWPDFSFAPLSENFWILFGKIISFDPLVSPKEVTDFIFSFQILALLMAICEWIVYTIYEKKCKPTEIEANPRTSEPRPVPLGAL